MNLEGASEHEIYELLKLQDAEAWRLAWENAVLPEARSLRSGQMARRFGITAEEMMSLLYVEMIGGGKINLFRDDGGSLWGWMRQYVRGYITRANPNPHGEFSLEGTAEENEHGEPMAIPTEDFNVLRSEVWDMTHLCFKELWNDDPRKAYVLFLKTRMHLSSAEVAEMFDLTEANVDQIFSRSVKQMRENWRKHEKP